MKNSMRSHQKLLKRKPVVPPPQVSSSTWSDVYGRLFSSALTFSKAQYATLLTGFVREGCYHIYLEERAL